MAELAQFYAQKVGAPVDSEEVAKVMTYLQSVFFAEHPPKEIGPRTTSEMKTIAAALDALGAGSSPELGGVLMQRLKALEQSALAGSWRVTKRLELVPIHQVLASVSGRRAAARDELLGSKLKEAGKKGGSAER